MTEEEEKKAFAALLLKYPTEPFRAGLELFPSNTTKAAFVAAKWPIDPFVLEYSQELKADGGDIKYLPSEADLARKVWDRMIVTFDPEAFAKLGKLYAEVRGFIKKSDTNVNVNATVVNKVMVVKDLGTDEAWENKAAAQQRKLLDVSTSKH